MKFTSIFAISTLLAYKALGGAISDQTYQNKKIGQYQDDKKNQEIDQFQYDVEPVTQDSNCLKYDDKGCCACVFRTQLINGKCKPVSDLCQAWDSKTALCTACYSGYSLNKGVCKIGGVSNSSQPYCTKWDSNGKCRACAFRTVWKKGKCVLVSDFCKTWNPRSAACTCCYDGYRLKKGACII